MLLFQIQDFFKEYLHLLCMLLPVEPHGIKPHSANGISTYFINRNPVFSNGPRSLPGNPLGCTILYN